MSELKGQILGVILVIILFGIISVAMTNAFNTYSKEIDDQVTEVVSQVDPSETPVNP